MTIPACFWRWRMPICAAIRTHCGLARRRLHSSMPHLEDRRLSGFLETSAGEGARRSNPHMHLLEAFLAWHSVTGDASHLRRAEKIIDLFKSHFFDPESWTLGEFFDDEWRPEPGEKGSWTEPGHHFEWASLLVDFAQESSRPEMTAYARKLYASAIANGLNRATGLAYGAVSGKGFRSTGFREAGRRRKRSRRRSHSTAAAGLISSRRSKRGSEGCFAGTSIRRRWGCGSTRSTSVAGRWRPKCRQASFIISSAR